jgi:dTDP-4-amino-4,6-dideoxygalactose transaminase
VQVPISKPCFGEEERSALLEPLDTGWVAQGPRVAEFERRFAAYTGSPFAAATTSGTTALHLALVAGGISSGDEVIVPAFTWVACANVVEMQGARPVFVDVELDTFNVDVTRVEAAITARTRAIMPVSLFGISAPMGPLLEIARRHDLLVVEDAACGVGAWYHGHHAGTLADIGCFSFHPRKVITTGEGGMVVTSDQDLARRVRSLRDQGASPSGAAEGEGAPGYLLPDFNVVGYNYRMTDLQGALGVSQMGRLDWILAQRRRLAHRYDEALAGLPWLRGPITPPNCEHGYQAYVSLYQREPPTLRSVEVLHRERNALMAALDVRGVATRPGTHAVHLLGYYRRKYGLQPEEFPNALLADKLSLALPLYAQMTEEEQAHVVDGLRAAGAG